MSLGPDKDVNGAGNANDGYDSDSIQSQNGHDATGDLSSPLPQSQPEFATQVQISKTPSAVAPELAALNGYSVNRSSVLLKSLAQHPVDRTNDLRHHAKTIQSATKDGDHEGTNADTSPSRVALAPRDVNDNISNNGSRSTLEATPHSAIPLSQEEPTGQEKGTSQRTAKSASTLIAVLKPRLDSTSPHGELSLQDRITPPDPVENDCKKISQVPSATLDETKIHAEGNLAKASVEAIEPSSNEVNHDETQSLTDRPSDPWEGMTRINRRDIKIPSEQETLLQSSKCWVPPPKGKPWPEKHVPQNILEGWIRTFSARSDLPRPPAHPRESAESASPSQTSAASDSKSESEAEVFPWSSSPAPEHDIGNRHLVPPDSSPPEPQAFTKPHGDSKRMDAHGEIRKDAAINHIIAVEVSPPAAQIALDAAVVSQRSTITSQDSQLNDPTYSLRSHVTTNENESGEESDMDISVPQALEESVQGDIASQLEVQEISSSVPSGIPRTLAAKKIQIVNTPAAGVRGNVRTANPAAYLSQTLESEQSSSAATKSSQSMVANSYDDNGHHVPADKALVETTQSSHSTKSQVSGVDSHDFSIPSHQDSQALVEFVPNSSNLSMDHDVASAQMHADAPVTQEESTQGSSLVVRSIDPIISLKRPVENIESVQTRSPKRRKPSTMDPMTHPHQFSGPPSDGRPDHRLKIDSKSDSDKAHEIFDKFKRDYASYSGDYTHFTRMCAKLQILRSRGMMQRSFLWDDFVIQHLRGYAIHLQYCLRTVDDLESYETYFHTEFSTPDHKKRSLTASGIALVALECAEPVSVGLVEPVIVNEGNELSVSKDGIDRARAMKEHSTQTDISGDLTKAPRASHNPDLESGEPLDELDYFSANETHETASIELGDDEIEPGTHNETVEPSAESDSEDSVIASMQKRCQRALEAVLCMPVPDAPEPSWSDDPNTPLKRWAREDQNLLMECRRRGGRILTDERGIIIPEQYTRIGWENGMPNPR